MQIEIAVVGRHFHDLLQLHEFFANTTISDQALDGANAQAVLFPELHQFGQTRHGAVIVQNFAKHSRRLQASHSCQIDRRLSVPRAPQHPAVLRAQREYVAWLV